MSEPAFRSLQVVAMANNPAMQRERMVGLRGYIHHVRAYPDGRFRYSVGSLERDGSDGVDGIYDEADLVATGEVLPAEDLACPGAFQLRDVVTIASSFPDRSAAEKRGYIDSWGQDTQGHITYAVRLLDDGVEQSVSEGDLEPTGERMPRPARHSVTSSTLVGRDGTVHGTEDYVVIDAAADHL